MKYFKRKINSLLRSAWVHWWIVKTTYKDSKSNVLYPFSDAPTLFVRWVASFSDSEIASACEHGEMDSELCSYFLKARQEVRIRRFRHWEGK